MTAWISNAENEGNATGVPGTIGRSVLRLCCLLLCVLALALPIAHVAWNSSGSGQWTLSKDDGQVKLWTLKTPGSSLVQVKAAVRVKSRLAGLMRLMEDMSCADAGCYDEAIVERLATPPGQYAAYIRFKFDVPGIHTQDYVLLQQRVQDADTRKVTIDMIAAPSRVARDACCVRITHLHTHWTLTPTPDGHVDIEYSQDTDSGGLPYPIANLLLIEGTYQVMRGMQDLMEQPRYRIGSFRDIRELPAQ